MTWKWQSNETQLDEPVNISFVSFIGWYCVRITKKIRISRQDFGYLVKFRIWIGKIATLRDIPVSLLEFFCMLWEWFWRWCATGWQCNFSKTGVMWSRFLVSVTIRASVLMTSWIFVDVRNGGAMQYWIAEVESGTNNWTGHCSWSFLIDAFVYMLP